MRGAERLLPSSTTSTCAYPHVRIIILRIRPTQSQEFSIMSWSKNGMYLAVGTIKGNLLMYNR